MHPILKLRDLHPGMVQAWKEHFAGVSGVEISQGDIFGEPADALVSPANSFGFMDGGIDLAYSEHFGWDLQQRLRDHLLAEHDGELPVGQAVIIATHDPTLPWLISAPTMRIPHDVSETVNAYLAFRAVLRAVRAFNRVQPGAIGTVLCPGLGTAIGRLPFRLCAQQMRHAYNIVYGGRHNVHGGLF